MSKVRNLDVSIGHPADYASEVGFIDFTFGQTIEAEHAVAKSSLAYGVSLP